MNMKLLSKFACGSVAGAVLCAAPSDAGAWWVLSHASSCFVTDDEVVDGDYGVKHQGVTGPKNIACPLQDSSATPKTTINAAYIHLANSSTFSAGAKACWADDAGTSGACSSYSNVNGSGSQAISLNSKLSYWSNANDFGFAVVTMNTPGTRVAGLYYQGP
jgi:hypothetical protein